MGIEYNPGVVTDGLVFHYDMSNTKKSWKGAPTTNLIGSTPLSLSVYAYATGPVATTVSDESYLTRTANRYTITQSVNVARAVIIPAISVGVSYTFSCKIKYNGTNVSATSALFYADASKGSPEGTGLNNTFSSAVLSATQLNGGWWYLKYTFNASDSPTGYCKLCYGINTSSDATFVGNTFDIYDEQFEVQSFASPFVANSRSNTQALIDLTGNNTITATSLTYASDNTFSFNGTSNTISCGNATALSAITGTSNVSIEAWVNYSAYGGGTQPYSVITHKGSPWAWLMENPSNIPRIRFSLSVSGDVACSDTTTHALNTWYHFVGTYDGSYMRFYNNGVLKNSVAGSGTVGGSGVNMVVGSYSGNYFMNGTISIVKIYNRTLSAAEVSQNFNALRGRYGL